MDTGLVTDDFDEPEGTNVLLHYLFMSMIFLASIGIAFVSTSAAKYFWLTIWISNFLLDRERRRRLGREAVA
jgi:hypothetical protein